MGARRRKGGRCACEGERRARARARERERWDDAGEQSSGLTLLSQRGLSKGTIQGMEEEESKGEESNGRATGEYEGEGTPALDWGTSQRAGRSLVLARRPRRIFFLKRLFLFCTPSRGFGTHLLVAVEGLIGSSRGQEATVGAAHHRQSVIHNRLPRGESNFN